MSVEKKWQIWGMIINRRCRGMLHHMTAAVFVCLLHWWFCSNLELVLWVTLCHWTEQDKIQKNDFHSTQSFSEDTISNLFISFCKTKLKSSNILCIFEACIALARRRIRCTVFQADCCAIQPLCSIGEPQIGRLTAHSSSGTLYSSAAGRGGA